ncbi:syntaxin-10 isoform X3 [Paroedura picta]|uniref:syntaxin-10 isoform X3 n=1 Tax=Paroedura picta TaxID=143630 RepID=UPI004057A214
MRRRAGREAAWFPPTEVVFIVKLLQKLLGTNSEVQKAVNSVWGLYQRWCQLLQEAHGISKEEFDWTTNELRNSLRSIDWDLEDLEETICIVESNPCKFKIEPSEVAARRAFVTDMQGSVKEIWDHISSPTAQAILERKNREMPSGSSERCQLLDAEGLSTVDSHALEEQQLHQKLIIDAQDEQLELVSGSIGVLKYMSGQVGEELDEQAVMLEDFTHETDSTHSQMDGVLLKMARLSHITSETTRT